MTSPETPDTVDLETALAKHLASLNLARYSPDGVYSATGLPAIFFGQLPDTPDSAILINVYNDDRTRDSVTPDYYVQLRFRSAGRDKRVTERLGDSVFQALDDLVNDRSNTVWDGIRILNCHRHLRAPVSPDAKGRYTRPDSYTITPNPS